MSEVKTFMGGAGEALCWMVECTMASLEHAKHRKSTSKIVATGLHNCRILKLKEVAHGALCHRVERALSEV